jgi:polysaccharide biosynthesis/export protein
MLNPLGFPSHRRKARGGATVARLLPAFALLSAMVWAGSEDGLKTDAVPPAQASYKLQPSDEITVRSLGVKEIADKTFRVDEVGETNFPLIGRITVVGKTAPEVEEILVAKLRTYYLEPDVEISIVPVHAESMSVIGAVGAPGVRPLKGRVTLLDALTIAGGMRPDAGPTVVVTREKAYGQIPHADLRVSSDGDSVAEFDLRGLLDGTNPDSNVVVRPNDVISVPSAQNIYVVGNVKKGGGFSLSGRPDMSVSQAVALAEGLDPRAAPTRIRVLRRSQGSETQMIVDLKQILAGKAEDLRLYPNDVVFVPNSTMKVVTTRTIEAAIAIGTGFLIWH